MSDSIQVPARTIAAPTTISEPARATLSSGSALTQILAGREEPHPDNKAAWHELLEERERLVAPLFAKLAERFPCHAHTHSLASSDLIELTPRHIAAEMQSAAALFFHPGSYTSCKGVNAANIATPFASKLAIRTFASDYRLPPAHPFPAAVEDSVAAYEFLLRSYSPDRIIVAGRSAGGGLAAAMVLKARAMGLPMPAACILQTPQADLTESGDSFATNLGIDNFLRRMTASNALYADGHDLTDPYLSPLFGDFLPGFPPTLLTSGTRDLFLSNTVLLHRKLRNAGIEAELHVWEAMGHGGFFGTAPEDEEVWGEVLQFSRRHLK